MSACRAAKPSATEDDSVKKKTLKVLALHGKGSSGEDFVSRLGCYHDIAQEEHGMELDVVTVDGPIPLSEGGFCWWSMPPFVRSYNATEYEGFETSSELVLKALETHGPFDIIYGHSQGAILTTTLLALQRIPVHPKRGYVLNGCAWPNPYSEQLSSLKFDHDHDDGRPPNVLLITGLKDKINAPDTQERVKESLMAAGAHVSQIIHPGGHNIPLSRGGTLSGVIEWMVQ